MMNKNEITKLAEKARQGNKTAFEKLYKGFYPKVYYFAKQNVKSSDAAEDITAETFCSAMEHISELHSSESFVGWLYCIAYHKCMDYNKKTALDRKCLDDAAEFAALGEPLFLPDDYAVNEQTKQQLQTIIDSLPPDMRSVIILYYYDNLSVAEVAKVIGTNKNNAAQKLHTARKKLRSKIEKLIGKGSLFSAVPLSAVLANLENAGLLSGAAGTAAAAVGAAAVGVPVVLSKLSGGTAKELTRFTFKYWRKHKKNLAALLFSGVLLCAVVCCAFLMIRQDQRRWLDQYYDQHGFYTVAVPTPSGYDKVIDLLSTDETVQGRMYVTGEAGIGVDKFQIGTIDDPENLAHIPMEEGRMPKTESEIAIGRSVLNKFGFFGKVGDDITLDTGTYKLVGIISKEYDGGRPGSLISDQNSHQNDTYYTDEMKPKYYMPIIFTGGDGSKNAKYSWVMLYNTKEFPYKSINSPLDELDKYLRENGFDYYAAQTETNINLWDHYNNMPAVVKFNLIGYQNINISPTTRKLLFFTGLSALIAVLSVIATLKNIFAERENTISMLRRIGMSKRRIRVMYTIECIMLTLVQTALGLGLGSLAHFLITKAEVSALGKKELFGFTTDPLITNISLDPFIVAVLCSMFVLAIGYVFLALLTGRKRRFGRHTKAHGLYRCISKVFANKGVTVIQTLSLSLICFGVLFGYMVYHNTTGSYNKNEKGEVQFTKYIDTKYGELDLEQDYLKECYHTNVAFDMGLNDLPLMKNADKYYGIDDTTADTLDETFSTGILPQTFIAKAGDTELKYQIAIGTDEEKKFIADHSCEKAKALINSDKKMYRTRTRLTDKATVEKLSQYVTSGSIDIEKLNSGEQMLFVVTDGEPHYSAGEKITVGSSMTKEGYGIEDLTICDVQVGAVIKLPKDMDRVLKHSVSDDADYNLLTTVTGAQKIGLHGAMYTELLSREEMGDKLPLGTGFEVFSLKTQRREIFKQNAQMYISIGLVILLMSLLGFAAYFNGIGMKIRLKEYQLNIMRAVGTPVKRLRRRLTLDSIKIPVFSAVTAYGLMRLLQQLMLHAHDKSELLTTQAADQAAQGNLDRYHELFDKATEIGQRYLVGSQMWYVGALVPTLVVFGVMCIVTIMLTRKSFKMFTPNIAYSISKGRKRR
ncbi:MAG: sigma-70 family RNA polymerase sigma factor [Ruminococcus sp.]|nr:sigma-70 family RNA polymerase sigma factor [Ruminococcus sp.]